LNLIVENIKKEDSKSQEKKNPKIPPESKSSIEFSTTTTTTKIKTLTQKIDGCRKLKLETVSDY
jgi:hypothetical protein